MEGGIQICAAFSVAGAFRPAIVALAGNMRLKNHKMNLLTWSESKVPSGKMPAVAGRFRSCLRQSRYLTRVGGLDERSSGHQAPA